MFFRDTKRLEVDFAANVFIVIIEPVRSLDEAKLFVLRRQRLRKVHQMQGSYPLKDYVVAQEAIVHVLHDFILTIQA
jgi:hypothetical protein